jgi:hypothetical protein
MIHFSPPILRHSNSAPATRFITPTAPLLKTTRWTLASRTKYTYTVIVQFTHGNISINESDYRHGYVASTSPTLTRIIPVTVHHDYGNLHRSDRHCCHFRVAQLFIPVQLNGVAIENVAVQRSISQQSARNDYKFLCDLEKKCVRGAKKEGILHENENIYFFISHFFALYLL